jgi:serine/threonine protein kinase
MRLESFLCFRPPEFKRAELIFETKKSCIYQGTYRDKEVAIKYCYYNARGEIDNLLALKGVEGVLQIYYWKYKKNCSIIIVDLCYGGDLFNWLQKSWITTRNDWATIKTVLVRLIGNVIRCHAAGIIHCDIKLDNIGLLSRHPTDLDSLVLLDLGSSICMANYVPETHVFIISPQYAAPELCEQKTIPENQLPQIDFWSIGIIAYIMATGHYPAHKSVVGVRGCHCDPHFKSVIGPIIWEKDNFDTEFNTCLHKLLERDVSQRYDDTTILTDKWLFGDN